MDQTRIDQLARIEAPPKRKCRWSTSVCLHAEWPPMMMLVRKVVLFAILGSLLVAPLAAVADQPVNDPDHDSPALGNATSESEVSAAVFGSTVVVGWNDTRQGVAFSSLTGYGYSTDGGATFTDAGQLPSPPGNTYLGDPALAVDRAGAFFFASLIAPLAGQPISIAVTRSASINPVTFGPPVIISGLVPGANQDKELIAVDTSGGPFDGRVYVAWTEFAPEGPGAILFTHSTSTDPLVFAPPVQLSPPDPLDVFNQGAVPVVAPNGDVYVVWGRFVSSAGIISDQSIQIAMSTDGGATFHNPDPADPAPTKTVAVLIPTPDFMTSGGVQPRTRGFPAIAVDQTPPGSPTHGNLYVAYQARPVPPGDDRADVFFAASTDGGRTWSPSLSVNKPPAVTTDGDPTTNDNWEPSIAVSPTDGQITVSFYDRRLDPANFLITVYRAVSTDGGLTWVNRPVSAVGFAPDVGYDPVLNPNYMGDYNDAAPAEEGIYLVWTDLRNECSPPTGAVAPCSPPGRSDMDVYDSGTVTAPTFDATPASPPGSFTPTPAAGAAPEIQVGFQQAYAAGCGPTFAAVKATLAGVKEPVARSDPGRGVIETASIPVDNAELTRIVAPGAVPSVGVQDGRYAITFRVRCTSPAETSVVASAAIFVNDERLANPLGGYRVPSGGVLETEHLDAIGQTLPASSPVESVVFTPPASPEAGT